MAGGKALGQDLRLADEELLGELLLKTSRTFALAIPLLPPPTAREVTIAYLLFRIADTFEDATVRWSREERTAALGSFASLVREPSAAEARRLAARWSERPPVDHAGYTELLAETPTVMAALTALAPPLRQTITHYTIRTAEGMGRFVERTGADGVLRLADLADLRAYCYVVAGIVGEMLTELFLLGSPTLEAVATTLRERAAAFGEGLQLTNILKDTGGDSAEGRNFLPPSVERSEVFALARRDLVAAQEYCLTVQRAGGPDGVVAFTALSAALAGPTLDRVERRGPGSKISRLEVSRIVARVNSDIAAGRPVFGG
jgi:farnesyl-diphosphate farnesyltransferase